MGNQLPTTYAYDDFQVLKLLFFHKNTESTWYGHFDSLLNVCHLSSKGCAIKKSRSAFQGAVMALFVI